MTIPWILPLLTLPNWEVATLVCLGIVGIILALGMRRFLPDTTLTMVWGWGVFSWCFLCLSEIGASLAEGAGWSTTVRYAATATTFTPMMAVLGAKRPHHIAWNVVVLSLWVVLALPAAESFVLAREIQIHAAISWFIAGLIVLGLIVWLPTRFKIPAILIAAGQTLSCSLLPVSSNAILRLLELTCFVGAAVIALRTKPPAAELNPLNRIWLDFRDLFGSLWALRVMDRVNAVCTSNQWAVRLKWKGFEDAELNSLNSGIQQTLLQTMYSILRRFVATEWIHERGIARVDDADEPTQSGPPAHAGGSPEVR